MSLAAAEVERLLDPELNISSVNAPSVCTVGGHSEAITVLEEKLTQRGVKHVRLPMSFAAHTKLMDSALEPFARELRGFKLNAPRIPCFSNMTARVLTDAEATDPGYWARQLRHSVRFSDSLTALALVPNRVFLEVGPGRAMSASAKQHAKVDLGHTVISSTRHSQDASSDVRRLLDAAAHLWLGGAALDWDGFYADQKRHRVPLPTYPFERKNYLRPALRLQADRNATTRSTDASVALELSIPSAVRKATRHL